MSTLVVQGIEGLGTRVTQFVFTTASYLVVENTFMRF